MSPSLGRIRVELAETVKSISQELVELINRNVAPPVPVEAGDVYVRTMYVVSDAVNSYGGRFEAKDHPRLAAMLVDSPVMVGHRKDKLPVARTFHADSVKRDGVPWVRSYFYWLKKADRADNLAENIDGGIYKECSVAFTYCLPECSICGQDIRLCEHEPFREYPVGAGTVKCHYLYKKLDKLLETSLVYRGANRGTSISRESDAVGTRPSAVLSQEGDGLIVLDDLSRINHSASYLVVPRYEGLSVDLDPAKRTLAFRGWNHPETQEQIVENLLDIVPDDFPVTTARLVGLRGKQRCSEDQLRLFLKGQPTLVGRLAVLVYPCRTNKPAPFISRSSDNITARIIPHRVCVGSDLPRAIREIKTRHGVEIWACASDGSIQTGYLCGASDSDSLETPKRVLTLYRDATGSGCRVALADGSHSFQYIIPRFDENRFALGRRFVAQVLAGGKSETTPVGETILSEPIAEISKIDNGLFLHSARDKSLTFILRPMRLKGENGFLFYRAVRQE